MLEVTWIYLQPVTVNCSLKYTEVIQAVLQYRPTDWFNPQRRFFLHWTSNKCVLYLFMHVMDFTWTVCTVFIDLFMHFVYIVQTTCTVFIVVFCVLCWQECAGTCVYDSSFLCPSIHPSIHPSISPSIHPSRVNVSVLSRLNYNICVLLIFFSVLTIFSSILGCIFF